jgi:hypothetical protein
MPRLFQPCENAIGNTEVDEDASVQGDSAMMPQECSETY